MTPIEFTVEKKEVTTLKGNIGQAIWEGELETKDLALLYSGISPTLIHPDRLLYYLPPVARVPSDWIPGGKEML